MHFIETGRLYLREMNTNDANSIYFLNHDPDVIKYTGDVAFKSKNDALYFLENYDHYKKHGFGRWAVIDKSSHDFLGWCGLKYSPEVDEIDIGFRFFKKHWNKGFATESAQASIKLGFEKYGISEIVGRAMVENIGSVKVLEKIGLTFVKKFDFDGENGMIYSIRK